MHKRVWVFAAAVLGLIQGRAAAAEEPLLVVVEAAPEVDADAGEIRRAVSGELGLETVAPAMPAAELAERALIVGVERTRIAVALRGRYEPPVVRVIPSPAEHGARVRAIAWLAGNLVRDQVSGIVASAGDTNSALANLPVLAAPASALRDAVPAPDWFVSSSLGISYGLL